MKRVMFLLIALGVTAPIAQAVDEFATPRPSLNVKTKPSHATRAQEVYVPERRPGTVQPGASVNTGIATPPRVVPIPGGRVPGGSDRSNVPTPAPEPQLVNVPNLVGQPVEIAAAVLGKPGLALGDRSRRESDAAAGTVIAQSPVAGTRVKRGTNVDVTIATSALVAVPDLTGETPRDAARLLRRAQLGLGQEGQRESEARPGTVIRQSLAPGTRVPRETLVNILVATAPPAQVPPPAPYTPPAPPRPQPVIVPPIVIEPTPPAPPVPVVVTPSPAPPVVTPPPAPPAPVAVAPPAPAPVRKPTPKPVEQPKPVQQAPPPATSPLRAGAARRGPSSAAAACSAGA